MSDLVGNSEGAAAPENQQSTCVKTNTQISCAVTAQLISAFVFASQIVQSLFHLNPKFQASSLLLRLYRPVCVRPGPEVIKLFSCSTQLRLKFILLINVKMPRTVGILTFMSRINY